MHRESCRILRNSIKSPAQVHNDFGSMGCIDAQFLSGLFNPCAVLCEPNISLTILSSIPDNCCGSFDFLAPTSGVFDLEIGPYSGEFDQAFLKKSNARGFARGGGGWSLLEFTQTICRTSQFHLRVCLILNKTVQGQLDVFMWISRRVDQFSSQNANLLYSGFSWWEWKAHGNKRRFYRAIALI